jgi:hypothetical protein
MLSACGKQTLVDETNGANLNSFAQWQQLAPGNPPAATLVARSVADSPPIRFPIIQRWHGDFGVFRVGMMHRFGIVPQRLRCEPLRVTGTSAAVAEFGRVGCSCSRIHRIHPTIQLVLNRGARRGKSFA